MLNVYVGHDPREQLAYDVCVSSIEIRSMAKVNKLSSIDIPKFNRPKEQNQSTDFTYTRFMVPYLNDYKGWALFVDCDFIFLEDPENLLNHYPELKHHPVSVVKHPPYIPHTEIKMDGIAQHAMWRKNWASLMLLNCEQCTNLTPEYVNTHQPGRELHKLLWASSIGSIPMEWNCLDDYYHLENPKAIHYTDGGPWFDNYKQTQYSNLWNTEHDILQIRRRNDTIRSI